MSTSNAERLAGDGTFLRAQPGKYWQDASVGNYAERLRKSSTGREAPGTKIKDRETAARAEIAEYKLATLKGDILVAADVERALVSEVKYLRGALLALPKRIPGLDRRQMSECDREVREMLTELANSRPFAGSSLERHP